MTAEIDPAPNEKSVWRILHHTRFNLIVLAIGVGFLVFAGQGADIVLGLADGDPQEVGLFYFGVILWAWQSWFWARFILIKRRADTRDQDDAASAVSGRPSPERQDPILVWYPRALGLIAFGSVIVILARTHGPESGFTIAAVIAAALYLLVVVKRRAWRDGMAKRWPGVFGSDGPHLIVPATVIVSFGTALVTATWALADPVGYGFTVGSAPVLFIALASILPVGSVVLYLTDSRGIPIVSGLIALSVVSSFWVENHEVRSIGVDRLDRPDAWTALDDLQRRLAPDQVGDDLPVVPVVFVATAGGGIRAAYWTSKVLTSAEAALRAGGAERELSDHLCAISGVSGGSVGAAFYVAALADVGAASDKGIKLDAALANDFLGPALTGLMVQDLMQSVVPWNAFEGRGAILERAFERAWAAQSPDAEGTLAKPVSRVARLDGPWLPRLLLNGTNDTTGQRMLAGGLPPRDARGAPVVVNALDQDKFLFPDADGKPSTDLRLSTAAHNSARFPGISPAGILNHGGSAVIDGGYFENFGAATLVDLLDSIRAYRQTGPRPPMIIRPIVIQISSDPSLGRQLADYTPPAEIDGSIIGSGLHNRLWNLVGGPLGGMLRTREARGVLAVRGHMKPQNWEIPRLGEK
jgi:hypothetical protein